MPRAVHPGPTRRNEPGSPQLDSQQPPHLMGPIPGSPRDEPGIRAAPP